MSAHRRALSSALAIAFCLSLLAAASALAITPMPKTVKTTVGMSEKFPAFFGKLHSPNSYCVANRTVKLYREARSGPDKLLGTDKSESDGSWAVPIGNRLIGGAYYATVTAKKSSELSLTCKAGQSQVAVVD